MRQFAELVKTVAQSTKTLEKQAAIARYFQTAPADDKLWTLALFTGRRIRRVVNSTKMHEWCAEVANIPLWLFEESYHSVGDLGETIALILPESANRSERSLSAWMALLQSIDKQDEPTKKAVILQAWNELGTDERFVFNKLIGGQFRIGVSQALMVNALAKAHQLDPQALAHRISGNWTPGSVTYDELLNGDHIQTDASKPYPFYLAYALESNLDDLGAADAWQVEWKWDGIRGQLICRNKEIFLWSRGEELMTEKFPEYQVLQPVLPDGVVLDGEILPAALTDHSFKPLTFNVLQTRIGRKNVTKKQLQEAPVVFVAYDLLEWRGEDIRQRPMAERRLLLEELVIQVNTPVLILSPEVIFKTWADLDALRGQARDMGSEGFMLKRKDSIYQAGRRRGDWWKWKIAPMTIDCVLVAAQKGHGRRANIYTDYTFAVRNADGQFVTFTKAYSGLTDKEFLDVDAWIKRHILERFGPVRTVKPELVFEIAFEGIAASKRHKSGVALRFPRMLRWRKDKTAEDINTLEDLQILLQQYGGAVGA